jgi:WhiB family redox-sensing transcriptional regulator
MSWQDDAACRDHHVDLFFGPGGRYESTLRRNRRYMAARAVCAACPVFDECREWALANPDPVPGGLAAGLTHRQRDTIRLGFRA